MLTKTVTAIYSPDFSSFCQYTQIKYKAVETELVIIIRLRSILGPKTTEVFFQRGLGANCKVGLLLVDGAFVIGDKVRRGQSQPFSIL